MLTGEREQAEDVNLEPDLERIVRYSLPHTRLSFKPYVKVPRRGGDFAEPYSGFRFPKERSPTTKELVGI